MHTWLDLSEAKTKAMAARTGGFNLQSPEQFTDIFTGMKTGSGKLVTRETAIRCSGVLACIRILMEDIATIPLILKRKTTKGAEDAIDHPGYRLLKDAPNQLQTSVEVREHIMLDYLLTGRFAAWQQRDSKGQLVAIYPLHADRLHFQGTAPNNDLIWNYSSPELTRLFTQNDLWRGNMMSQYVVDGRALIFLAREAIGLLMAAEEQGARFFSQGVQTSIALTTTEELDTGGRNQLRDSFQEAYGGSGNSWKPLLLENGLTVAKVGLTAAESQYLESRKYQLEDIARIFRVPDVLLGVSSGKTATFASAQEFFQSYVKHTIMPWAVRIEQTIQRDLILPGELDLFAKHQLSHLLRADQITRYKCYQVGIASGFLNRNEPRIAEDLDTVDGLDDYLIPLNMVTTDAMDAASNPDGTGTNAPQTEQGDTATPPNDDNSNAARPRSARKLAGTVAASIVRSERKQFSKGKLDAAWHVARVSEITGSPMSAVKVYSDWRRGAADPLEPSQEAQAYQKLVNLCLGVTL